MEREHPIDGHEGNAQAPEDQARAGDGAHLAMHGSVALGVFAGGAAVQIPTEEPPTREIDGGADQEEGDVEIGLLVAECLVGMRQRGAGHLIYVASISSILADVSGAAYQASKRGL